MYQCQEFPTVHRHGRVMKNGPEHTKCSGPLPFAEAGKGLNWLVLANLGGEKGRVRGVRVVLKVEGANANWRRGNEPSCGEI